MQNLVRYNVINQDGRPVIRAVPVPRRLNDSLVHPTTQETQQPEIQPQHRAILRRIRRLRLLDIR